MAYSDAPAQPNGYSTDEVLLVEQAKKTHRDTSASALRAQAVCRVLPHLGGPRSMLCAEHF
jgi:hypothetical protein